MKRAAYVWSGLSILCMPACVPLRAADVMITSVAPTQTQIVIQYVATSPAPCIISVTDENNGINPPHDVDPTLFPNSNLDLGRTTAAGFRWPAIVSGDGLTRTVVLGGHDEVKLASDGKWYSTALQVATAHGINIACNGGADTASIEPSTTNIPQGSTYPEAPIPAPGSPLGGMAQPTIDWSDRAKKYIDPMTGVVITRMTGPTDNFDDTNPIGGSLLTPVLDLNGAWTNPNNLVTNQAGTLASTSTANAPLFAAINYSPPGGESFTDFLITPYGSGSSNSVVSEWCLSTDSGQTCANYTPLDVTFSTATGCQPTNNCSTSVIPSATPSSNFSAWGGMKVAFGTWDLVNSCMNSAGSGGCQGATVTVSGSTVTIDQKEVYPGFNVDRVAGSKFLLSSCLGDGSNVHMLTVSAVNTISQITVQESGLNLQNCAYQDYAVGLRVILKNNGTLNVSFQMNAWAVRDYGSSSNGSYYPCARTKVADIQTDCDGKQQSPPLSGYLCGGGNNNIYLLQDNGRICLQGNGYFNRGSGHISQSFQAIDARTFYGLDYQVPAHLWKIQHVPNNYTEMAVDARHTGTDRFTYTDITSGNPIGPQIAAAGGTVANALATGLWGPMYIDQIMDDGSGGSVIQYRTQLESEGLCMLAWADAETNTLKTMLAMYGSYPFNTADCHFGPGGAAGYSNVNSAGYQSNLAPWYTNTSLVLGGPFLSNVLKVHQQGTTWNNWTIPVTGISAASPAVMTAVANDLVPLQGSPGCAPCGPAINNIIGILTTCSGAAGAWSAVNGTFYAHQTDPNHFSLFTDPQIKNPVSATGASGDIGSPSCSFAPPAYSISISSVSNNGGNARMTANVLDGYVNRYPSKRLVMRDGDPITIAPNVLNQTVQYYGKVSCSGCNSLQFDVYKDAALTTPATFGPPDNLSGAKGWFAVYAETCPDPTTITLPGPMYSDTGIGATGAGNQKVRCMTLRLASEPESDFPYDTGSHQEHVAYPPPPNSAEASNVNKSMLHQINVGDAFGATLDFPNQNHELLYVLRVDRSAGENQIDVTVVRNYGDQPGYGGRGTTNNSGTDSYSLQHAIGWGAWQEAPIGVGLVSTFPPLSYAIPPGAPHNDLVSGTIPGTITTAQGYYPGAPDDIINGSIAAYASPGVSTHNSVPVWGAGSTYQASPAQSYPSKRTVGGQASPSEMVWKGDWMAMNPSQGTSQNAGALLGWNRALTNIRGTTYDTGNTTTMVWKIAAIGTINIKLSPVLVHSAPHTYFADKSGPGSLITDADAGKFCIAYIAGECRPNSAQWDVFFAGTGFFDYTACISDDAIMGSPCAFGLWPGAGWAVQVRMTPIDKNGTGVRRLTQAFWLPPNHYSYSNWVASADGKWGFFASNPIQQRPRRGMYEGTHLFVMKLPPWPSSSTAVLTRGKPAPLTTFVNHPVQVFGHSGDSVRVSFGYGENGDVTKFYCTTRLETCWTSAHATPSNPYVFDSESQSRTACGLGCTVQVPAIPGRVLYYRVEHADGTLDAMQAAAIL